MSESVSQTISQSYEIRNERMFTNPTHCLPTARQEITDLPESNVSPAHYFGNKYKSPIWSFSGNTKTLESATPITVEITKTEDLYLAENSNLLIVATGSTIDQAIHNFNCELISAYEFYHSTPKDKLIGKALELKDSFKNLFKIIYYEVGKKKS